LYTCPNEPLIENVFKRISSNPNFKPNPNSDPKAQKVFEKTK